LESWICRIIIRCALDGRRDGQVTETPDLPEEVALVAAELAKPDSDPELARALRALAPRQRLIVFLRYFADLPIGTIADVCGISAGTVSATLAQAKTTLLSRLRSNDQTKGERAR
jgi:RNA polymerase sigma factor (sigma-70 family)